MKHPRWIAALAAAILTITSLAIPAQAAPRFRVLVFSKTTNYYHESIPAGVAAIQKLGADHDFEVEATTDATAFTDANLARFDALVFNNTNSIETSPPLLDANQRAALQRYIRNGGGWAGLHAATASERDWAWYAGLVGTIFDAHGDYSATGGTGPGRIKVLDRAHPSTKNLPELWERDEEWYNWRTNPTGNVHTLAQIKVRDGDTKLNEGVDHAYSWCQKYDGGRSWYTAGGHAASAFSEPLFLEHLRWGIEWAAGKAAGDCGANQHKSYQRVPLVTDGLSDPFELAVAPDKRVFYIERTGALKVIDQSTLRVTTLLDFDYNAEQTSQSGGLIGMTMDKDFATTNWLYLLWSDKTASRLNLSRFTVSGSSVPLSSEKRLLTIPVFVPSGSRAASHLGGSLAMDRSGNLFAAIGDNTDPFQSSGFSPLDERAGRSAFDAQTTAGNTNDLRGKVLRIKPQADGTYTIPAGNLFAPGTAKTRPEIYGMGFRNPFRITVDSRTNSLLVADYGPDARAADPNRGPEGTVEFNRITAAGNYGWPYCVGNNTPFTDFDFATNTSGAKFTCAAPVNNSPNNTGLTTLPAAKPALVWYAYSASTQFPEVGTGGGGPMSGPVYDFDPANANPHKFPEYFEGKWIVYELTRQWWKTLSIHETAQTFSNPTRFGPTKVGDLQSINGIFGQMDWTQPIEAEFGPDGALYVIDFGQGAGSGRGGTNEGAGIYRIDYTPDGPSPIAAIGANKDSGPAPLTVAFSSAASTGTNLTYKWDFDDNGTVDSTSANPSFTYSTPGKRTVRLTVSNVVGTSVAVRDIVVGNTRPTVKLSLPNGGVFEWGDRIPYSVTVTDPEDTAIDCSRVVVQTKLGHDSHAHPLDSYTGCSGTLTTDPTAADGHGEGQNLYAVVSAQYTDGGATGGIPALTGSTEVELRPRFMEAEHFDATQGGVVIDRVGAHGAKRVGDLDHGDWIKFSPQHNYRVPSVVLGASSGGPGATIEFRADSPTGQLLGSVAIPNTGSYDNLISPTVGLTTLDRTYDLYLVVSNPSASGDLVSIDWLRFNGQGLKNETGASGTASVTPASTARTMTFTATVTPPPGRTIVDKAWVFGDNSADVHSYNTSHTYAVPGTYTAWLVVTDSAGARHSITRSFTVG